MADIFLSHSSADGEAAADIMARLRNDRPSWKVFLDSDRKDGISLGEDWHDRLGKELLSCRVVLALVSKDWINSRWCFTEATFAKVQGKDFFPLVLPEVSEAMLEKAPSFVRELQNIDFDAGKPEVWQHVLDQLDQSGLDPDKWFSLPDGVGPYPGSVAFEERDAGVFFGRDDEITHYLEVLTLATEPDQTQAVVISGGSGSGKSSLVKAGLIPRLKRKADWIVLSAFDPNREPLHRFLDRLGEAAAEAGIPIDLPAQPPSTAEALIKFLEGALRRLENAGRSTVLITIDQAEALLAAAVSRPEGQAAHLFDALGQFLKSGQRRIVVLFTIRTEFYPALEEILPAGVRPRSFLLEPIKTLAEVIEKPAKRFGIDLGPGLVVQMVDDTRGSGGLPLLAYTLRALYEQCRDENELTLEAYNELGGVEGAIEKKLGEALGHPKPTEDELDSLRRTLVHHLIRVDEAAIEGERFLRSSMLREQLPEGSRDLIKRLENVRLIAGSADGTIAIAHERLINDWQGLEIKTWLDEARGDRKALNLLQASFEIHQDGGPLLIGKPLDDAKALREKEPELIAEMEDIDAFITSSIEAQKAGEKEETERRRRAKMRRITAIASAFAFLFVVSIAAFYFFRAEEEKIRAVEEKRKANWISNYIGTLDFEDKQRANIARTSAEQELKLARVMADIYDDLTNERKCSLGLATAFTCLGPETTYHCAGKVLDVPEMKPISSDRFLMGSSEGQVIKASPMNNTVDTDELPSRLVDITAFEMAAYEVTVADFCAFAADPDFQSLIDDETNAYGLADKVQHPGCFIKQGNDSTYYVEANWQSPGFEQNAGHPVTCVNWFEASAYALWLTTRLDDGYVYRLPSEAEWAYAAGGRVQAAARGPDYFWGDDFADGCDFANGPGRFCDNARAADCDDERGVCKTALSGQCVAIGSCENDSHRHTAPVGSFAPNDFGLHDTAGNVWEWASDWYHHSYEGAPLDGSPWLAPRKNWPPSRRELEANPPDPKDAATLSRSVRGGSWENFGAWRLANRGKQDPLLSCQSLWPAGPFRALRYGVFETSLILRSHRAVRRRGSREKLVLGLASSRSRLLHRSSRCRLTLPLILEVLEFRSWGPPASSFGTFQAKNQRCQVARLD